MPTIVGLTGGIGAGKSTVAKELRRLGVKVINLDLVGRQISRKPAVVRRLNRIAKIKGGRGERARLRAALFANPKTKKRIERFLHPLIWKEFRRQLPKKAKWAVCEAALLIESKHRFTPLVVVMAPKALRKRRAMKRDRISSELFESIASYQCDDKTRRRKADYLIYNHGSEADLKNQTRKLFDKLNATA